MMLLESDRIRPHQTSEREVTDLRAIVHRDLADASLEALSDDRRFATAYNAALQTAKMVIACSGYRVSGSSHHATTFEAIEIAMGSKAGPFVALFETCRRKRNQVDYDMSGIATRAEVEHLINQTGAFLQFSEDWIRRNYPALGLPEP